MAVRDVCVSSLKQIDNYSKKSKKNQPKIQQELTASRSNRKSLAACDVISHTAVTCCLAEANRGQFTPKLEGEEEKKKPSFLVRRFFTVLDWFGLSRRRLCFHSRVIEADTSRLRQDSPPTG